MNRETIAKIICESSLWNCGKDSHNALSELTESIYGLLDQVRKEERERVIEESDVYLAKRLKQARNRVLDLVEKKHKLLDEEYVRTFVKDVPYLWSERGYWLIAIQTILSDLRKDNTQLRAEEKEGSDEI